VADSTTTVTAEDGERPLSDATGRLAELQARLADRRSRRVIFVSHCLLNENVRYLGGACYPGPVTGLVDKWRREGVGICQMSCPEQRAWGGVLKRAIAPAYGASTTPLWPFRSVLLFAFQIYTRLRYRWLAHAVSSQIEDYQRSGYQVAGVVGVAGSPSCGVRTTLDVRGWLEVVGRYRLEDLEARRLNAEAIQAHAVPGRGWFIAALARPVRDVPFLEHDMLAELRQEAGPMID
jgi:hypothetical protein